MRAGIPALAAAAAAAAAAALASGCTFPEKRPGDGDAATTDAPIDGPVRVLGRPSRSSTVAISDDDAIVAMVNPEDGSVSFFTTSNHQRLSRVPTGLEPSTVVLHPDGETAYVANRADGTVVAITGIRTATPVMGAVVEVGSEPTGLALSPTGARLFVAEYAESRIGVIDTATMTRSNWVTTGLRNPRAITVTNDGDTDESDELVVVPEFFGEVVTGQPNGNDARRGRIRRYAWDGTEQSVITLSPYTNTEPAFEATTWPNQLYAAVPGPGRTIYIPTISASPNAPLGSSQNVYPVVYVANLDTAQEVVGTMGSKNLAELVNVLPQGTRFFLGDLVDLAFAPSTATAYAVSRAASVVQVVDFGVTTTLGTQIDLLGAGPSRCELPTGIVTAHAAQRAYVNCWGTRRLAVIDLTSASVSSVVESAPLPTPGSTDDQIRAGRAFFFTGRGRWSGNGTGATDASENGSAWSSCGTCHPDGLTDNITWIFATGPRQSTSLDGSFSHGVAGTLKQRIFNWTAVLDEIYDFELNARGVSGGKGAITTSAMCGNLTAETRTTLTGSGLASPPIKEVQDSQTMNCTTDWDRVDLFVRGIRPPRARRYGDTASVSRGAALFAGAGGCARCHGGTGWTVSNRFFIPATSVNTGLQTQAFTAPPAFMTQASPNATQVSTQLMSADTFVAANIPPLQLTCALRNVGTFGVPGSATVTDALEARSTPFVFGGGMTSSRAQGRGGYNVPALYGLALGAPYLHHGKAVTLDELFTNPLWLLHTQAGNPNFLTGVSAATDRADLINFLLTIDANTAGIPVPAGFADGCTCPGGGGSC